MKTLRPSRPEPPTGIVSVKPRPNQSRPPTVVAVARLAYLGTPELAVPPLRALAAAGHEIPLVVTGPDRRRGRGRGTSPTPVKAAATELGIPTTQRIGDLLGLEPSARARRGGRLRPAHPAPDPGRRADGQPALLAPAPLAGRGAGRAGHPGRRHRTGVCVMAVEEGLDTGPLYASEAVEIGPDEHLASLRERLVERGTALLLDVVAGGAAGLPDPVPQEGEATYADEGRPGRARDRLVGDGRGGAPGGAARPRPHERGRSPPPACFGPRSCPTRPRAVLALAPGTARRRRGAGGRRARSASERSSPRAAGRWRPPTGAGAAACPTRRAWGRADEQRLGPRAVPPLRGRTPAALRRPDGALPAGGRRPDRRPRVRDRRAHRRAAPRAAGRPTRSASTCPRPCWPRRPGGPRRSPGSASSAATSAAWHGPQLRPRLRQRLPALGARPPRPPRPAALLARPRRPAGVPGAGRLSTTPRTCWPRRWRPSPRSRRIGADGTTGAAAERADPGPLRRDPARAGRGPAARPPAGVRAPAAVGRVGGRVGARALSSRRSGPGWTGRPSTPTSTGTASGCWASSASDGRTSTRSAASCAGPGSA